VIAKRGADYLLGAENICLHRAERTFLAKGYVFERGGVKANVDVGKCARELALITNIAEQWLQFPVVAEALDQLKNGSFVVVNDTNETYWQAQELSDQLGADAPATPGNEHVLSGKKSRRLGLATSVVRTVRMNHALLRLQNGMPFRSLPLASF
jgi:hypothetical protein